MAMKTLSSPRRVYLRNDWLHVLYAGTVFGARPAQSNINTDLPVRIAGNNDGTITLTQRAHKKKGVSEVWSKVRVPCYARS